MQTYFNCSNWNLNEQVINLATLNGLNEELNVAPILIVQNRKQSLYLDRVFNFTWKTYFICWIWSLFEFSTCIGISGVKGAKDRDLKGILECRQVPGYLSHRAGLHRATDQWASATVEPSWRAGVAGVASTVYDKWGPRTDMEKEKKGGVAPQGNRTWDVSDQRSELVPLG